MATTQSPLMEGWPEEAREAAQLVIDQYGEPDEATDSQLTWQKPGPWKRIVASRAFYSHHFPVPHFDSVESVIDYRVPPEKVTALAQFDGSVIVERTVGEVSARCHDEQANFLALNLMHDIVTDAKTVETPRRLMRRGPITPRSLLTIGVKSPPLIWKSSISASLKAIPPTRISAFCQMKT